MHKTEITLGYNGPPIFHVGVTMKPGKTATYDPNVFNTWLDYHLANGMTQADIIRRVNEKMNKKYTNMTFYNWKTKQRTLPDVVYASCILPDLAKLYEWYFKQKCQLTTAVDFQLLAAAFSPCVKIQSADDQQDPDIH